MIDTSRNGVPSPFVLLLCHPIWPKADMMSPKWIVFRDGTGFVYTIPSIIKKQKKHNHDTRKS